MAPPGTPAHDTNDGVEVSLAKPGWRHVTSRGSGWNYEGTFWFGGMQQRSSPVRKDEPTITPTCSLAKLFATAHQAGVSAEAVGHITIDEKGYELRVNADGLTRVFMDHDCKRAETDDERRDREKGERDAERDREHDDRDRGGKGKAGNGKSGKHKHN